MRSESNGERKMEAENGRIGRDGEENVVVEKRRKLCREEKEVWREEKQVGEKVKRWRKEEKPRKLQLKS